MRRTTDEQIDRLCSALKSAMVEGGAAEHLNIGEFLHMCAFPREAFLLENEELIRKIEEDES